MTAYLLSEIVTTDENLLDEYRSIARQAVAEFGGRYLVRNRTPEVLEGELDDGVTVVVLGFDTLDDARAFYTSSTYAPAIEVARKCMSRRIVIVEGTG
ncbi:DUF1330 domain-containing protein [Actinomycetospora termitidis]|uniref:DUF1330 domain-containing protein n=1 Tax=Actinomycetospora termitidis TaxID=3053470 RepID=A0ABT7M6R1_9PSEU|nr:DUF1330 domain-containing protein [Actinomycetospora sp. Odt1-22]MDL5156131.1 DUF1330 domain-containing protein [Actinomycetospora sp. Odt1-22]